MVGNGAFTGAVDSGLILNLDMYRVYHALSAHLGAHHTWALRTTAVARFASRRTLELLRARSEAHGAATRGRTRATIHRIVHHAALVQLLLTIHVELVLTGSLRANHVALARRVRLSRQRLSLTWSNGSLHIRHDVAANDAEGAAILALARGRLLLL